MKRLIESPTARIAAAVIALATAATFLNATIPGRQAAAQPPRVLEPGEPAVLSFRVKPPPFDVGLFCAVAGKGNATTGLLNPKYDPPAPRILQDVRDFTATFGQAPTIVWIRNPAGYPRRHNAVVQPVPPTEVKRMRSYYDGLGETLDAMGTRMGFYLHYAIWWNERDFVNPRYAEMSTRHLPSVWQAYRTLNAEFPEVDAFCIDAVWHIGNQNRLNKPALEVEFLETVDHAIIGAQLHCESWSPGWRNIEHIDGCLSIITSQEELDKHLADPELTRLVDDGFTLAVVLAGDEFKTTHANWTAISKCHAKGVQALVQNWNLHKIAQSN